MIDKDILKETPMQAVMKLTDKYKFYWQDRSNLYWMWRLLQKIFELIGSLVGLHKDPVKWELIQIASICINWMYKIPEFRG